MKTCPVCRREYADTMKFCPHDGEPLPAGEEPVDPMVGRTLGGRYEVLEYLGGGGFGTVYRVRNLRLDDVEALKIIRSEHLREREPLERFRREAKLLRKLGRRSPHIVDLYGLEEDREENLVYFTMEHVPGVTLTRKIGDEGALEPARALRLVRQICSALELAHGEGVIHRDLKLDNVLVVGEGPEERVKILDFGIAKVVGQKSLTDLSRGMPGTLGYAAPEQIRGEASKIGVETDLFAAGVILYNLLTGRDPWRGDRIGERTTEMSDWEVIRRTLEEDPVPLRQVDRELPGELEAITLRLLEKEPADRYRSAAELDEALAGVAPGPSDVTVEARGGSVSPGGARSGVWKVVVPLVAAAALVGLALGVRGLMSGSDPLETPPPAEPATATPGEEGAGEGGPVAAADSTPGGGPGTGVAPADPSASADRDVAGSSSEPSGEPPLALRPVRTTLEVGETAELAATGAGASGAGPGELSWSSDRPDVAAVDAATGAVSGVSAGVARVTARRGGRVATATITVVPASPSALELDPRAVEVEEGGTVPVEARLLDARGDELPGDVEWSSRVPDVAGVAPAGPATGRVRGLTPGTARIEARAGGIAAEATVRVTSIERAVGLSGAAARMSGGELVVTSDLDVRGFRGEELCVAALFFGSGGDPMPGEPPYALGGQVSSWTTVVPESGSVEREVRIVLPASELELNDRRYLGNNELEVRTVVWAGACAGDGERADVPLTSGGATEVCVARSAGGYLPCR